MDCCMFVWVYVFVVQLQVQPQWRSALEISKEVFVHSQTDLWLVVNLDVFNIDIILMSKSKLSWDQAISL